MRALKRTHNEISDIITKQDKRLRCAEDAARITEKTITTLAAQYKNIRERLIEVKKRERGVI